MKKTTVKTIAMVAALMAAVDVQAQVRETTTYDDGSYYTGVRDGKGRRHGNGLMVFANGDRYEGDWKKGIIDGEGTYIYAQGGYSYTGHWVKGNIKGHGTFRFNNGNVMEGDWTAMGTGTGSLIFPDGTRYDGPFVNGAPQGQGVKIWADGTRYEGSFVQGHLCGQGSIVWADGSHYEGAWLNDQYEGEGTYTDAAGEVVKGRFHAGNLVEN
ncbi:MAG: hypothetical protein IJ745_02345 [Bacteroidales bacterium]|nr:hypothetical protein [Bacteroidales bacterium]